MATKIVLYYNDLKFEPSESFLFKDFGQVPFVLSQLHGTDLEYWIAALRLNPGFSEFRGARVRQFGKTWRRLPDRLDFLRNSALHHAIDRDQSLTHFVLFPFTPLSDLLIARAVRKHRPGAKIILKLDANLSYLQEMAHEWARWHRNPLRIIRQCHHYRELLRLADVVLCETSECEQLLRDRFLDLDLDDKLVKTFSGLSKGWLEEIGVVDVPDEARRQAVIVSGRLSAHQKHTAMIFEAEPPPPGWMIEFIGEIDDDLANTIEAHRAACPGFDNHYRFHGMITDKRRYFELLMGARALLMNSRGGEGFPNVFAEAHYCRLSIISSDVSGADDATQGGRWGLLYPPEDIDALSIALQRLPAEVERNATDPALGAYRRRFVWEHSLDQPQISRLFASRDGPNRTTERAHTV